jgi:hypothetical protein
MKLILEIDTDTKKTCPCNIWEPFSQLYVCTLLRSRCEGTLENNRHERCPFREIKEVKDES